MINKQLYTMKFKSLRLKKLNYDIQINFEEVIYMGTRRNNVNIKKVYSKDKAIQLVNMGNEILYTEDNYKNKRLKVFCFIDTDKLNNDWKKLI